MSNTNSDSGGCGCLTVIIIIILCYASCKAFKQIDKLEEKLNQIEQRNEQNQYKI